MTLEFTRAIAGKIAAISVLAAVVSAPGPAAAQAVKVTRNITYTEAATQRGSKSLALDIYTPPSGCRNLCRTVVLIHGGGFRMGSKDLTDIYAEPAARARFGVIAINYRLIDDRSVLSAQTEAFIDNAPSSVRRILKGGGGAAQSGRAILSAAEDVSAAINWIAANGSDYGLDGSRVALWGASAGAAAAMATAYGADDIGIRLNAEIAGVVGYWGSLARMFDLQSNGAPMMLVHGSADSTVPIGKSQNLFALAQERGVRARFFPVNAAEHGLPVDRTNVDGKSLLDRTFGFLNAAFAEPGEIVSECLTADAALCPPGGRASKAPSTSVGGAAVQNPVFQMGDKNADGFLTRTEFLDVFERTIAQRNPRMAGRGAQTFRRLDQNGDNKIAPSEMPSNR